MIPKIIHYCWFGGKRKPKLVRDCIASWEKYLPEYQIIEWNEKNTDLSHPFTAQACRLKKWAFVADYVRLDKIIEYGGIYLDTDMLLLKNLDIFLDNDCFFGAEDSEYVNAALFGAIPDSEFVKSCKSEYEFLDLEKVGHLREITIPQVITRKFRALHNFTMEFNIEVVHEGVKIYPSIYFYPFPLKNKKEVNNFRKYIEKESYAVHLWSSSWVEYSDFEYFKNGEYFKGFCKMIKNLLGDQKFKYVYFRKIASAIKGSLKK